MSHVSNIQTELSNTRLMIQALTGIDEVQLNEMVYNAGIMCLERVLGSDAYGITEMPKRKEFWNWFRMQWHRQDETYLDRLTWDHKMSKWLIEIRPGSFKAVIHTASDLVKTYKAHHRQEAGNIYLNTALIEQTYHGLIKQIHTFNKK